MARRGNGPIDTGEPADHGSDLAGSVVESHQGTLQQRHLLEPDRFRLAVAHCADVHLDQVAHLKEIGRRAAPRPGERPGGQLQFVWSNTDTRGAAAARRDRRDDRRDNVARNHWLRPACRCKAVDVVSLINHIALRLPVAVPTLVDPP